MRVGVCLSLRVGVCALVCADRRNKMCVQTTDKVMEPTVTVSGGWCFPFPNQFENHLPIGRNKMPGLLET